MSKAISMVISIIATFYIARTLGPQNFGELSYAQSVIGILALFGALTGVLYRDIVKHPERENTLLGTAWTISFSTAFMTSVLALGYAFFTPHDQLTIAVIAILCVAQFITPFSVIQNVFYSKTETKRLSIITLTNHLLISTAKIVVMVLDQGVLVLASILVFEQVLIATSLLILYKITFNKVAWSWQFDLFYAKQLVKDSFPFMIVAASAAIAARIDQIFIKHSINIETVGFYGAAVQMTEMWQFLPGIILTAIFPAIVNARHNLSVHNRRLLALVGGFIGYGVVLSLIIYIFAPKIITIIYGEAFFESIQLLQIYIWSLTGTILTFIMQTVMMNENFYRIQIYTAVIPMILNVILNIILIPKMGAPGAAFATVISYSINPLVPLLFKPMRRLFWQK
ncbi:MAG: flippase [Candidatus Nomurabacteria bacterium]|nr:flippase [Candidatus Nomurabacteria bacterium]USN88130.1 MAG: flippase [Candidatus Nomurabacteria bacterium]